MAQSILTGVVHRAGRFVQQQDRRVKEQGAGQQYHLPLAAGEQLPTFANGAVKALWMLAGQLGDAGDTGNLQHVFVTDVVGAEGQVVAQAAGQQRQVVGDVANLVTQVSHIQLAQIQAVNQQLAFVGVVVVHQQPRQGTFARAAAADDANALAGFDMQVDVMQGVTALPWVAKAQLAGVDGAMQACMFQWALFGLALLRQSHERIGTGHGQARLLITGDQAGNLAERRHDPAAEHVAGNQSANAHLAGDDQINPADDGGHTCHLLQEQRAIGGDRGKVAGMTVEAGQCAVCGFPAVLALTFGTAGLEGFKTRQGFDQQSLAFGAEAQAFLYGVTQARLDEQGKYSCDREGNQRDDDQWPAEQADHQHHQQGEGQVNQAGECDSREEFTESLKVVDALSETADGGRPCGHGHAGNALKQGG